MIATTQGHQSPLGYMYPNILGVVPSSLQEVHQWITWRAGKPDGNGRFDKIPFGKDGTGAAWQQAGQWMPLNDAIHAARGRGHSGVGLVLPAQTADGMHLVALDFDGVDLYDDDSPRILAIKEIHKRLGEPYIESSPSGRGLRMFVKSAVPIRQVSSPNPHGGKDEAFCSSGKWVTVTGMSRGGDGVPDATKVITSLVTEWRARISGPSQQSPSRTTISDGLKHLAQGWQGWPETKLRDGDGREEAMLAYAGHLRAKGFGQDVIERICLAANKRHYEEPLEEVVVLDRARRYEDLEPAAAPDTVLEQVDQTDAGNVARLWELTQGDARYVYEMDVWIVWSGIRWEFDRSRSALYRRSLAVAATYSKKARRLEKTIEDPSLSPEQRKSLRKGLESLQKWIVQCRNRTRIDAMISLAQKDPRFVISATELDCDPTLMGVSNGVVCLRSGILRPDSRADYILRRSPIAFNPNSNTEAVGRFFTEITSVPDGIDGGKVKPRPRPMLAHHLKKIGGYCLTGLTEQQVMFMYCGKGSNGKSLLVDMQKFVMGEYAEVIQPEVLLSHKAAQSAEQASPSTRKLAGARCAITSESKDGAQLDVAVVKRHTGDSMMTARGLFEQPITFKVTHKLVLLTNYPPRVDQMDEAIKGRLQVIPFDMKWNRPGTAEYDPVLPDADKDLLAKLKAEAEGFLKFFVEGAVLYFNEGLSPPPEVMRYTQGYIASQDTVRRWVGDDCIQCSLEEGATAAQLHAAYRAFCAAEGESEQAATPASLGRRLKQMGYTSQRTRDGARYALRVREAPVPGPVLDLQVTRPRLM